MCIWWSVGIFYSLLTCTLTYGQQLGQARSFHNLCKWPVPKSASHSYLRNSSYTYVHLEHGYFKYGNLIGWWAVSIFRRYFLQVSIFHASSNSLATRGIYFLRRGLGNTDISSALSTAHTHKMCNSMQCYIITSAHHAVRVLDLLCSCPTVTYRRPAML